MSVLNMVKKDARYRQMEAKIAGLISHNAPDSYFSEALAEIGSVMGSYLMEDIEDSPQITWIQSFTDIDKSGYIRSNSENERVELGLNVIVGNNSTNEPFPYKKPLNQDFVLDFDKYFLLEAEFLGTSYIAPVQAIAC